MSFVLVVRMKVAEGNEERVAEVIPELAQASREEPGCELYIPCRDPEDSRSYLFYEQYRDKAAFEEHGASEHFQRLGAASCSDLMEFARARVLRDRRGFEAGRTSRGALSRSAGAAAAAGRPRPADPVDPARSQRFACGRRPALDDSRAVHGPVRAAGGVPLAAARLAPRPGGGARAHRRLRRGAGVLSRCRAADPADDSGRHRHGARQRAAARRRQGALRRPAGVRHRHLRGRDQRRRHRVLGDGRPARARARRLA